MYDILQKIVKNVCTKKLTCFFSSKGIVGAPALS